jgi:uncharacterized protein (DUF2249 family)
MLQAFVNAGFKPLLNPLLRRLLARATTLTGAARRKHWDAERLSVFVAELNRIEAEVPRAIAPPADLDLPDVPPTERHAWGVFIDNRGLEPPQPMMRIVVLLETLAPGERLVAHNDRVPLMLMPKLDEEGLPYELEQQADGSCRVTIFKP